MNGNAELLNYTYQNSEMGVKTTGQLLEIVEDEKFREQLHSQFREYSQIHESAKVLLNQHGYDEKGISAFEKVRAYMMINLQTLRDKSNGHIAEMMIIGSNMGVIDAIKNIRQYGEAESSILDLMKKLLAFEEKNIQALKEYL